MIYGEVLLEGRHPSRHTESGILAIPIMSIDNVVEKTTVRKIKFQRRSVPFPRRFIVFEKPIILEKHSR
jgi:hypothetical protein